MTVANRVASSIVTCLIAFTSQPSPQAFDALRDFRPFTLVHALVLAACAVCTVAILRIGLSRHGTPRGRSFERALGVAGLAIWFLANGYGFVPAAFSWDTSLPLHVCDLCALAGPIVLLVESPPPWLRAWLYFAGIGLCTQAFITPTLRDGPIDPMFWAFWSAHFVILIFALYDLIVRRWRPTWRDWRIAIALCLGYLAIIFPIDAAFDLNYGFLGNRPGNDTLLGFLGPWPWRVGIMLALTIIGFTVLMLPWWHGRRQTE